MSDQDQTKTAANGIPSSDLFAVALPDTRGNYCYLTDGEGDPPRTYTARLAKSFPNRFAAANAIIEARKLTPLRPRVMIVVPFPANASGEAAEENA